MSQQQNKQVQDLFPHDKKQITIEQLQNYLSNKGISNNIQQGLINSISQQTFIIWQQIYHQDSVNKLIKIQLFHQLVMHFKENHQIVKNVQKVNQKLSQIGQISISYDDFISVVHKDDGGNNLYQKYKLIQQSKHKNKPQISDVTKIQQEQHNKKIINKNSQNTNKKQQQNDEQQHSQNEFTNQFQTNKQSIKQNNNQKIQQNQFHQQQQHKNKQNSSNNQQSNINSILLKFISTSEINDHDIQLITKYTSEQCNREKLNIFKEKNKITQKVIDKQNQKSLSSQYIEWLKQQKKNKQKSIIKQDSEIKTEKQHQSNLNINKQQQKNRDGRKLISLLDKYFKPVNIINNKKNSHQFHLTLKHETSQPIDKTLNYSIKLNINNKINQHFSQLQQKNLFNQFQQSQFITIKIFTKKAQQLQQYIQQKIKQTTLKLSSTQFKTYTDDDSLNLVIKLSQNKQYLMNNLTKLIKNQNKQNHCRLSFNIKLNLIQINKQNISYYKFIKSLIKGFYFNLSVQGSQDILFNFRKNLQNQHLDSKFYLLLALSKTSQMKIKWKKIQDIDYLFHKLGILQAANQTPSIKNVLMNGIIDLFEKGVNQNLQISKILTTILSHHEIQKLSIQRLDNISSIILVIDGKYINQLVSNK